MMFLTRIRHYRVYRRLVLSYLLLSVITVTLVSTILYMMFSARAVAEIDRSSKQVLGHVSYAANVVHEQVENITGQLLSDNEVISFLYAKEDNKMVNYTASLFLARIQSVYPFIKNLGIYNLTTGAYIDSLGLQPDQSMVKKEEGSSIGFFPRRVESVSGKNSYRLLTFKIIPERSFTEAPKSAIVVDVDESYIRNTMGNISASAKNSLTFVMDASGTVLSHSIANHFMENISSQDYVRRILADSGSQGSFVQNIDGRKDLVSYVKSADLNWYFVSVRPYAEMISNIYELRNWTIAVVILLLFAAVGASLLFTGNIYNPIKSLLEKVSSGSTKGQPALLKFDEYELLTDAFTQSIEHAKSMETSLNRSSRVLKDSYLSHLLQGNANKLVVSADMKREWEGRFTGPYITVILFKIDSYRKFKERNNAFDRGLIRFAISNIANEVLSRSYTADAANMEEDEITIIIQSDIERIDDGLCLIIGEIQDAVRSYYKLSLSASIGDSCSALSEINDSYKSAQNYMRSRLFLGHGCIVNEALMIHPEEPADRYPSSVEKRLIDAVKMCRQDTITTEISEYRSYLSRCSYVHAIQYTNFLVLSIIKEFEYITEWWSVDAEQLYRTTDDLREVETLDDIENMIAGLCFAIVNNLEEHKKNTTVFKNAKIVEEIHQFVQEQFAEHGLSLEAAAHKVGFSSGYVGKLFKSMTGTTFNDYVTHIRMERAKVLLATTTLPIAQIGEEVGVYNVPYFTTLFKKKYGMTPSQYRERAVKE
ncbi:helix-turn-helix domain-containing protein [Paenibacillus gansuensis]|uniref:Helix-turn-helix domain-containing protein n=1 Tax=Paenibacillus gansuensis TaxID=306542 RepID=A0ABW5PK33_9BACL